MAKRHSLNKRETKEVWTLEYQKRIEHDTQKYGWII